MHTDNYLNILQYNIRNQKDTTLVPLLADPDIQNFDVLAIQEPWRNPHVATSYNPRSSNFHLAFQIEGASRICFYINKKIDPESWEAHFKHKDLGTLTVSTGSGEDKVVINIHTTSTTPPPPHMRPPTARPL